MSENQTIVPLARQLSWSQIETGSGSSYSDIRFQLTDGECEVLRSQIVTSSSERDGRRYPPYAITEQGIPMWIAVLGSEKAIEITNHFRDVTKMVRGEGQP